MDIVYATDGSAGAASAGELLARLDLTAEDRILLLAVTPAGQPDAANAYFRAPKQLLANSRATIETEVLHGQPAEQILARAKERDTHLIVLGAMGVTGLSRFLVGSVAERVMRHASRPVLVARPRRFDYGTVLVGVDSSPDAAKAVHLVAQLPLSAETDFCLANVLPSRDTVLGAAPLTLGGMIENLEAVLENAKKEGEARLRELAKVLQADHRKVRAEILRGDPSTALINAAEREGADLIVIGSHGEGNLDRFLLGSVSERVVRYAQSSVLVVR